MLTLVPGTPCTYADSQHTFDLTQIHDLSRLQSDYAVDGLTFNLCHFVNVPDKSVKTHAYLTETKQALTDDKVPPKVTSTDTGLTLVYESPFECKPGQNYSFTAQLVCDKNREMSLVTDSCDVMIALGHEAGCNLMPAQKSLIHRYPWVAAIIAILTGPFIALFGKEYFPNVVGSFAALLTLYTTLLLYVDSATVATTFSVGLLLSALAFYLARKFLWVSIILLGLAGGLILGFTIASWQVAFGILPYFSILVTVTALVTLGSLIFAIKQSRNSTIVQTSLIGSYFVVRGISWILGGWPYETDLFYRLYHGQEVSINKWVLSGYIVLLTVFTLASAFFQIFYGERRADKMYSSADDNFAYVQSAIKSKPPQKTQDEEK